MARLSEQERTMANNIRGVRGRTMANNTPMGCSPLFAPFSGLSFRAYDEAISAAFTAALQVIDRERKADARRRAQLHEANCVAVTTASDRACIEQLAQPRGAGGGRSSFGRTYVRTTLNPRTFFPGGEISEQKSAVER
jgi:hypothetical protein